MQLTQALKAVRNEALRDDVLGDRTAHWGEVFRYGPCVRASPLPPEDRGSGRELFGHFECERQRSCLKKSVVKCGWYSRFCGWLDRGHLARKPSG